MASIPKSDVHKRIFPYLGITIFPNITIPMRRKCYDPFKFRDKLFNAFFIKSLTIFYNLSIAKIISHQINDDVNSTF